MVVGVLGDSHAHVPLAEWQLMSSGPTAPSALALTRKSQGASLCQQGASGRGRAPWKLSLIRRTQQQLALLLLLPAPAALVLALALALARVLALLPAALVLVLALVLALALVVALLLLLLLLQVVAVVLLLECHLPPPGAAATFPPMRRGQTPWACCRMEVTATGIHS